MAATVQTLTRALGNKGRITLLPNAPVSLVNVINDVEVGFIEVGHANLIVRDGDDRTTLVPYEHIASVTYWEEHVIRGPIENKIPRGAAYPNPDHGEFDLGGAGRSGLITDRGD